MTEIQSKRNQKALHKGKLLVGYLLAGYPDRESFLDVVKGCESAGVDIFEIGFPAGNPIYDGDIIKRAQQKVDKSICTDVDYWKEIRGSTAKPIWLMGYRADLVDSGFYKVLASEHLIDAYVMPELTLQERIEMAQEIAAFKVDVVGLTKLSQSLQEVQRCLENFALVYQQLYDGPTGMTVTTDDYKDLLNWALSYDHVHEFAGFGINSSSRVEELLTNGFKGVIIGTTMIKKLNESPNELYTFTYEVASAVRKVNQH